MIAILSVVATLGLEAAANFVNRTATSLSRERLQAVDEALDGYFKIYGRLPCPAVRSYNQADASLNYGLENCSGAIAINSGGVGNGLYAGAVPYRTLNMPVSYSLDGFSNKVNYVVTVNLTSAGGSSGVYGRFASSGGTSAQNGTAGIEVRTGELAQPCNASNCQVIADPAASPPSGAAYFLFSNGADQRGAVTMNGVAINACIVYANEIRVDTENCLLGGSHTGMALTTIPNNVFYDNRYNPGLNLASYYDDVAVWRSKAQL